jgi:beta-N-acetylhexosaminidase
MGLAATRSIDLAHEVSKATATEIAACGINLIMGPCLDVLTNTRNQPLGVRSLGDDPREVSSYGVASMKGYQEAGIATVGKHFPSHGSLEFLGSKLDVPTITESLEQLNVNALIPFRKAIDEGLDAMLVGGCAMSSAGLNVMHACLSERVVDDFLRRNLRFNGVVLSDCLEIEALSHNIGIGGGTVMAVNAGCDLILLCRSSVYQKEAIEGLKLGLENAIITKARVRQSLRRVLKLKAQSTSWEQALNPPGTSLLSQLQPSHAALSTKAYDSSITVVRDSNRVLPLTNIMGDKDELLLLTPLVKPLVTSAALQLSSEQGNIHSSGPETSNSSLMSGERVFRQLGRSLARQRSGRVLHSSYTANGLRPQHESLIDRARAVIVITADATRHLFQNAFTKHVSMLCNTAKEKSLIVVAVSCPYDFALDQTTIGTYICTYDFTENALTSLVKVLYGELAPTGALPGTLNQSQKLPQLRQHWLVEAFSEVRDASALDALIHSVVNDIVLSSGLLGATSKSFLLRNPDVHEAHFVVRNSSTQALYGFCSTYHFATTDTGVIGTIFVDPRRRNLSIGHSLHDRAIRSLLQHKSIRRLQLGSRLPSICLSSPALSEYEPLRTWFTKLGWDTTTSRSAYCMVARHLNTWQPPFNRAKSLQSAGVDFDLVHGWSFADPILDHIKTSGQQQGLAEVYKLALANPTTCGVLRAKNPDGVLLGTVVLYNTQSAFVDFVPAMKALGPLTGGISSPIISPSVSVAKFLTLLQGLIMLGMWKFKQQGCHNCIIDHVS